jgi:small multidrug resistance pump
MFCMCWIWLFLAIFLEVAATTLMKMSNGLTRTAPTVGIFVLYGLSFVPMAIALKQMEIGAVYAIWSAVGTALATVLGVLLFDEAADALKVVGIVLIIAGVVCLDVSTRQASQTGVLKQTAEFRSDLPLSRPALAKGGSKAPPCVGSSSVGSVTGP